MTYAEALAREARRLNERYLVEVVERFGLCPWAAQARRENRVKTLILLQDEPSLFEPSLGAVAELAADADVEIGLLVYPRLALGRLDFEHFARHLRKRDADRHEPGCIPFALAAFHPDARPDPTDAERLIPFLRRTPDPTLQLVRTSVVERVRGQFSGGTEFFELGLLSAEPRPASVRERIARANLATVTRVGIDQVEAALAAIRADREHTYAALAERAAAGML